MSTESEARAAINGWLAKVPAETPIAMGDDGICRIDIGEIATLTLEHAGSGSELSIYVPLLSVPPDIYAPVFGYALSLNLYQRVTRKGVIAFDPEARELVYNYNLVIDNDTVLDPGAFLGEVAATSNMLASEIAKFSATARDVKAPEPGMPAPESEITFRI